MDYGNKELFFGEGAPKALTYGETNDGGMMRGDPNPYSWKAMAQNSGIEIAYQKFVQAARSLQLTKGQLLAIIDKLRDSEYDIDYDFIKMFLFPEKNDPCRLPSRYSLPTATFTHRFSFTLNTGSLGAGVIALLPHDTAYTCVVQASNITSSSIPLSFYNVSSITSSDSRFITDIFCRVRLLAASINCQYMGPTEQDSGIFTGCHLHSQRIGQYGQDVFDDGYYVTRGRPTLGTRLVWTPKDDADLEFRDTSWRILDQDPATANGTNIIYNGDQRTTSVPKLQVVATDTGTATLWSQKDKASLSANNVLKLLPGDVWGIRNTDMEGGYPQQLGFMWQGLPLNQDWIRVDVTRHFEAIPYPTKKDYIAVKKGRGDNKTLDALKCISKDDRLFGHTLAVSDQLMRDYNISAVDYVQDKLRGAFSGSYNTQYGNSAAINNLYAGTIVTNRPQTDYI